MPDGQYLVGVLTHLDDSNSVVCPRCGERVMHGERICAVCAHGVAMRAIARGDCVTITRSELDGGEVALRLGEDGSASVVEITSGEAEA